MLRPAVNPTVIGSNVSRKTVTRMNGVAIPYYGNPLSDDDGSNDNKLKGGFAKLANVFKMKGLTKEKQQALELKF